MTFGILQSVFLSILALAQQSLLYIAFTRVNLNDLKKAKLQNLLTTQICRVL